MFQLRPLPRTINAALRDAGDPKASVRRSALADLSRLAHGEDRDRAVSGIVERLRDDIAQVRADAVLALADAEARTTLDALVVASSDAHALVRQMVVLALGELAPKGHREALQVIGRALGDPSGALRFQGLIAAHKLDLPDRDHWLEAGVSDSDSKVRYVALRLVDEWLAQQSREPLDLPDSLGHACSEALRDTELEVRVAAGLLYARTGEPAAAAALVEGLNHGVRLPAPEDEQELIEVSGELRLDSAEPGLVRQAWGRLGLIPGRFAWQAKVALARLGNPRAQKEILKGLRSWDRDTRTSSVVAAGKAGLGQARERLLTMRETRAVDLDVVTRALREIG